ncbi:hypothetical protein GCM10011612_18970 [Actinomyces gaoshouyii]|uniref:Pectate lyase n=1 Tax=Actinomyces gaoshouyii TaxID=1960083 RepID=A0A8H9HEG7_9ACTO|nr:hypothetical protein GCM10011612_18970 [Actinomyces gaoshouyii]
MKTITFAAILIICALGALISPTGNAQDQGTIAAWTSFDGRADAEKVSIESMTYEELPIGGGSSPSGGGGGGQVVVSAA